MGPGLLRIVVVAAAFVCACGMARADAPAVPAESFSAAASSPADGPLPGQREPAYRKICNAYTDSCWGGYTDGPAPRRKSGPPLITGPGAAESDAGDQTIQRDEDE